MTEVLTPIEEVVRPTRHFFVSPHYDDIALSSGGTASLVALNKRESIVELLFGSEPDPDQALTPFAEDMHQQWGMAAHEVIAGRRREEATASKVLGTRDAFGPFLDAIYRGTQYTSNDWLFGSPGADDANLPIEIIEWLGLTGAPDSDTRVYVPLAIGHHVDHQIAFKSGVDLARRGWDVWFYEDLPYALREGAREERFAAAGDPFSVAALVDVNSGWDAKISAIMAYPSQLAVIFGYVNRGHSREEIDATMKEYAMAIGGGTLAERFWKLVVQH
jgi:LmbE family N-acetylglucosaminyl deacetylase